MEAVIGCNNCLIVIITTLEVVCISVRMELYSSIRGIVEANNQGRVRNRYKMRNSVRSEVADPT